MPSKIIYLHGFNSSPQSYKAQLLLKHMAATGQQKNLIIPDISPYPDCAIQKISEIIDAQFLDDESVKLCFVGSSLGGYYSTWFAEKYNSRAALINPSVRPYETLAEYIGENENFYTNERWSFNRSHIQQLLDIDVKNITQPERYLVLLQTGDEVLDYRQAEKKYSSCHLQVEDGGDHSFLGFENHIDTILRFAGINNASQNEDK